MSDPVLVALIGAAQIIVVAWLNRQATKKANEHAAQTKAAVVEAKTAIQTLEKNTNSKMDELLKVTGKEQRAVGNLEGRAEQKAETINEEGSG